MAWLLFIDVSHLSKYKIPESVNPEAGLITLDEGHLYFGDHSNGFEFPAKKVANAPTISPRSIPNSPRLSFSVSSHSCK